MSSTIFIHGCDVWIQNSGIQHQFGMIFEFCNTYAVLGGEGGFGVWEFGVTHDAFIPQWAQRVEISYTLYKDSIPVFIFEVVGSNPCYDKKIDTAISTSYNIHWGFFYWRIKKSLIVSCFDPLCIDMKYSYTRKKSKAFFNCKCVCFVCELCCVFVCMLCVWVCLCEDLCLCVCVCIISFLYPVQFYYFYFTL